MPTIIDCIHRLPVCLLHKHQYVDVFRGSTGEVPWWLVPGGWCLVVGGEVTPCAEQPGQDGQPVNKQHTTCNIHPLTDTTPAFTYHTFPRLATT